MQEYIETGKIDRKSIASAIKTRKIFPVYGGSALKMEGVDELLKALDSLTLEKNMSVEFGAKVYKIGQDDKGVRLTFLKVTGGSLKVKSMLETEPETFEKVNEPLGRVKEKVDLSEYEIERILS